MHKLSLKHAIPFVIILSLVALLTRVWAQGGVDVRIEPAQISLDAGDTVAVSIVVDDVTDLVGVELHLTYDPTLVEVIDAEPDEPGIQLEHGGFIPADYVIVNQADSAAGTIDYAVALFPPSEPAVGSGPLAVIHLRPVGSGDAALVLDMVLLANSAADEIPSVIAVGQVDVTGPAAEAEAEAAPAETSCWPLGALLPGGAAALIGVERNGRRRSA